MAFTHPIKPALLMFGSQETDQSPQARQELRALLLLSPKLKSVVEAIKSLPDLGKDLIESIPEFRSTIGHAGLECLIAWLNGEGEETLRAEGLLGNTFRTTMTVISHLGLYSRFLETTNGDDPHGRIMQRCKVGGGIQGFCTGLVAAVAVACSASEEDFVKNAVWAVRLAFCIGVLVDAGNQDGDSKAVFGSFVARGKSSDFHSVLLRHMESREQTYISVIEDVDRVTVTCPRSVSALLAQELAAKGIQNKEIRLSGLFHSAHNHTSFDRLREFCLSRTMFRLSSDNALYSPVLSNSDAQPLTNGDMVSQILRAIVLEPCNWLLVSKAALTSLPATKQVPVLLIGSNIALPNSLARKMDLCVSKLTTSTVMEQGEGEKGQSTLDPDEPDLKAEPQWYGHDMVAVVGMGMRFPKANTADELWDLLFSKASVVSPVPNSRFNTNRLGRACSTQALPVPFQGCLLDDIASFDHKFFNKSGREAASTDPQQRILLEVAYEALQSAGYFQAGINSKKKSQNRDCGCYIGTGSHDYYDNVACHAPTAYSALGTLKSFLAGKISHFFGFSGPSMTCDTACSSSAVAIDLACKAIVSGECSTALAGGVSVFTTPYLYQNLHAAGFLSPTGQCKPFDAAADGYCRGEGVGLVVLKRLEQALADGDHVRGVIAASRVNQNTNEAPIAVPNCASQSALFAKSIASANIDATTVDYVEAHGTGTTVGDPIEYASIRNVFMPKHRSSPLHLGSLKGNIGHLEGASGVASLIKVLLMMEHKTILPQASFNTLNPNIDADANMVIPTTPEEWKGGHRRACINNYGASGCNATMLVYEAPQKKQQDTTTSLSGYPIFASAQSCTSLFSYCRALGQTLPKHQDDEVSLPDFVFNLCRVQNHAFRHLATGVVRSFSDVKQWLSDIASNEEKTNSNHIITPLPQPKPVILVFGGQSTTTLRIDKAVYDSFGLFRSHLLACDTILKTMSIPTLIPSLFDPPADDFVMYQATLFSVQYASAKSWLDSGLAVSRVIGHSLGQITALCISGVLSLYDALRLLVHRARLVQSCWGQDRGSMLAVEVDASTLSSLVLIAQPGSHPAEDELEIACYNGPSSVVVAGPANRISTLEQNLGPEIKRKLLPVTHAYHSLLTEPILEELKDLVGQLEYREPVIPVETCTSGQSWTTFGAEQIVEHTRMPVYFHDAVKRIESAYGSCIWLEVGHRSSVSTLVRRCLDDQYNHSIQISALHHKPSAVNDIAHATTELWNRGVDVQFWAFHSSQRRFYRHINLPPYQFDKTRHWLAWEDTQAIASASAATITSSQDHSNTALLHLNKYLDPDRQSAEFVVNTKHTDYKRYVEGHSISQSPLCPISVYIELVAQGIQQMSDQSLFSLSDLRVQSPLSMVDGRTVTLVISKHSEDAKSIWEFEFRSCPSKESSSSKTIHATGAAETSNEISVRLADTFLSFERLIDLDRFARLEDNTESHILQGPVIYSIFSRVTDYQEYYQGVRKVVSHANLAMGKVQLPQITTTQFHNTLTSPLSLDNFLQVAGLHVNCLQNSRDAGDVYVCTHVGSIQFLNADTLSSSNRSYIVCSTGAVRDEKTHVRDIFAFDAEDHRLQVTLQNVQFVKVPMRSLVAMLQKTSIKNNTAQPVKDSPSSSHVLSLAGKLQLKNSKPDKQSVAELGQGTTTLRSVLGELLEITPAEISNDSTLEEMGVDSLMSLEVISKIQQELGVTITSDEFASFSTYVELSRFVARARGLSGVDCNGSASPIESPSTESSSTSNLASSATSLQSEETDTTVASLLTEMLDISGPISPNDTVSSIGVDSLMAMELVAEINKRFDVSLDVADLTPNLTVEGLQSLISPNSCSTQTGVRSKEKISMQVGPSHVSSWNSDATPAKLFDAVRGDFASFSRKTGFLGFYEHVLVAQNTLVVEYIITAFEHLGMPWSELRPGFVIEVKGYLSKFEQLVSQLMKHLQAEYLIVFNATTKQFMRTAKTITRVSAEAQSDALIRAFPAHECEHRLLGIVGPQLSGILQGTVNPLELLFQNAASRALLERVYEKAPMYEAMNEKLATLISNISAANPNKMLRILEIGAGTGGTTRYVLNHLRRRHAKFEYVFTDISSYLIKGAKKLFGTDNIRYSVLDLENEPPSTLIDQFDLIISTNCVHATTNLSRSCSRLRQFLDKDGALLLVELTRNLPWLDVVFGVLDGWWLFNDGRKHALAHEHVWEETLLRAGFDSVDWTDGPDEEDKLLKIVAGFRGEAIHAAKRSEQDQPRPDLKHKKPVVQTIEWKRDEKMQFLADVYLPPSSSREVPGKRPIALLIHGGGHCMLSRKDIRPRQVQMLIDYGFLPVSMDYRLCPEVNILDGPMTDVADALLWARTRVSHSSLNDSTIIPDTQRIVVVGWSTGGTLALQTSWTASWRGVDAPSGILAFYCPTDYLDEFWTKPNYPMQSEDLSRQHFDLLEGVQDSPILHYNPKSAKDGWMNVSDPRSRILLHMNWTGQTLPILLNGLPSQSINNNDNNLPQPSPQQIATINPYSHATGQSPDYNTPTFILHGTDDDLVRWGQSKRFIDALRERGVRAEMKTLEGKRHLFDLDLDVGVDHREGRKGVGSREAEDAIERGLRFLLEVL